MKSFKAKLIGAIVLFIMIMLVPMIVLAVTNEENIQIISNTDEQEYIVYIQDLMGTNFASAVSNIDNALEQDLNFVTAKDGEGNYVAQIKASAVTGNPTYLYVKYNQDGQEKLETITLDLSKALDKTDMEYVENTTKRIGTETVEKLEEINEEINGVQTTLTVGGLKITETDQATYEYQLTKVEKDTPYSRLFALANQLLNEESYNAEDMYSKIQLTSEFYTLYNQLIEGATWTAVENMEIRQPNDAQINDQYVVLIKKTAEDGTVTTDAKLMVSDLTPYEQREDVEETRVVQETAKLPITGDSIILFVALAMVVIALIIVFARMKKLNKKEDK